MVGLLNFPKSNRKNQSMGETAVASSLLTSARPQVRTFVRFSVGLIWPNMKVNAKVTNFMKVLSMCVRKKVTYRDATQLKDYHHRCTYIPIILNSCIVSKRWPVPEPPRRSPPTSDVNIYITMSNMSLSRRVAIKG